MLIWGGDPTLPAKYYDPVSDTWFGATSTVKMPSLRLAFTAVWTGTEMIAWGGYNPTGTPVALNSGARYNPTTDTWTTMSTVGAPSARTAHRSVWTGTQMIVWGGDGLEFTYTSSGGIYDPATDTWVVSTATVGAPSPRGSLAAVWTAAGRGLGRRESGEIQCRILLRPSDKHLDRNYHNRGRRHRRTRPGPFRDPRLPVTQTPSRPVCSELSLSGRDQPHASGEKTPSGQCAR